MTFDVFWQKVGSLFLGRRGVAKVIVVDIVFSATVTEREETGNDCPMKKVYIDEIPRGERGLLHGCAGIFTTKITPSGLGKMLHTIVPSYGVEFCRSIRGFLPILGKEIHHHQNGFSL